MKDEYYFILPLIAAAIMWSGCDRDEYPDHVVHSYNKKKHLFACGNSWSLPCDQAKTDWQQRLCNKEFKGRNYKIRAETCRVKNEESGAISYYPCFSYKHVNGRWNDAASCKGAVVKHEIDVCGEVEEKKEE